MANRTISGDRLAALGAHLSARRFTVELTSHGLRVENPKTRASELITCRARSNDFGNLWFWTSEGEPISDADRLIDAAVFILGHLTTADAGRSEQ